VIPEERTFWDTVCLGAHALGHEGHCGRRPPLSIVAVVVSLLAPTWDNIAHARPEKPRAVELRIQDMPPPEPTRTRRSIASRTRRTPKIATAVVAVEFSLRPRKWLPSRGRECITRGRLRGFCQGPRRAPEPWGEAAERARRLRMGDRTEAVKLLLGGPPVHWVRAARERPSGARFLYPVENGRHFRGLGSATRTGKKGAMKPRRRKPHAGLDIGAPEGSPIRAMQSGIVVYSDNGIRGYGNLVMVVHGDGTVALYGHCRANYVFAGQHVGKGQVIAEVGVTGYARGAHLHVEYRVEGRPRDPSKLFD